jgi:hypothetical protein
VDCRWVESLMVIPCANAFQTLLVYIYTYIVKNICFSGWGKAGKGFCFTDRFWGNVSAPLGC